MSEFSGVKHKTFLKNSVVIYIIIIFFSCTSYASLWQWENPLPSGNTLTGIWGTASEQICAVDKKGLISCYNGDNWQNIIQFSNLSFEDIWGISNQWIAVGKSGAIAIKRTGEWLVEDIGIAKDFNCVWGTSFSNIFIAGSEGSIVHFDGNLWQSMKSVTSVTLNDIWGTSDNNIYAVGYGGILLHYNGSVWQSISNPASALSTLNSIWGRNENEIYVTGSGGILLNYDGNQWQKIDLQTFHSFSMVWGTTQKIFLFGDAGYMVQHDGNQWNEISPPFFSSIQSVWGTETFLYGVGNQGTIITYENQEWSIMKQGTDIDYYAVSNIGEDSFFAAGQNGSLIHYENNQWLSYSPTTNHSIRGVCGDIFVGDSGTAILYSDNNWLELSTNTSKQLNAIWKQGNKYYTVGEEGTILIFDGESWQNQSTLDKVDLHAVWGNFSGIYAVGDWGRIIRFDGTRWNIMNNQYNGTQMRWFAVLGTLQGLLVAGENGKILKYNGDEWQEIQNDSEKTINAIYEIDKKIFFVGQGGCILYMENGSLISMGSPTNNDLNALYKENNRLYAVGNDGTIISYPLPECENGTYTELDISLAQQYALSLAESRAFSEYQEILTQKIDIISNQNQIIRSQDDQIANMYTQNELNDAISLANSIAISQTVAEKNEQIEQLNQLMDTMYTQEDVNELIEQLTSIMYTQEELDLEIANATWLKEEEIIRLLENIEILKQALASKNLDIDCNGKADALTDGLLIIRYLFNLNQGASFTQNAVDLDNGKCITEDILRQNIKNLLPE